MDTPANCYAKWVADAFAEQYYALVQNSPEILHKYYSNYSTIWRPGLDGTMRVYTLSNVDEKDLNMLSSGGFDSAEVTRVISDMFPTRTLWVYVHGYFTFNGRPARNFRQSFVLIPIPQITGYIVYFDSFEFVANASLPPANNDVAHITNLARRSAKKVGDKFAALYYHHLQNSPEILHKYYTHNSEIVRPVIDGTMVVFTLSNVDEKDLKLLSYGGLDSVEVTSVMSQEFHVGCIIVAVDGYFTSNERPARRNFSQNFVLAPQETNFYILTDIFMFIDRAEFNATLCQGRLSSSCDHSPEIKADAVDDSRHGISQESQAVSECAIIYVKWIPLNATIAMVGNAFKQFGEIRGHGIEVKTEYGTNCKYAFVEFEEPDAAKRASTATAPILIGGSPVYVGRKYSNRKKSGQHSSSCDHSTEIKADAGEDSRNGNIQESQAMVVKNLPPSANESLRVSEEIGNNQESQVAHVTNPARRSAKKVADKFAALYYHHLQNSPEILHKYYKHSSKISRPGLDGTMRVSTKSDIDEKILTCLLSSGGFDSAEVTSVMSQEFHIGCIIVDVVGYFTSNERPARRNFLQNFVLAPQETNFYVSSDIFMFVDRPEANATLCQGQLSSSWDHSPEIKADAVDDSR